MKQFNHPVHLGLTSHLRPHSEICNPTTMSSFDLWLSLLMISLLHAQII